MIFKRKDGENEEQFLWRIGQAKDACTIDLDWHGIADIMNKEFREDESEYRNESAYRKIYQYTKKMYEAGVFNNLDEDSYIKELQDTKHEIRREKQKLFDERVALNKMLRESARAEEDMDKLEQLIRENGCTTLPPMRSNNNVSGNDLIIMVSDIHLGSESDNFFGTYNAEVAEHRLVDYLSKIVGIQQLHKSENAYVILAGDLISGLIHWTTQLENRENIIEQVQKVSELLSSFVHELSGHFNNVYVNNVSGNHSRLSHKDQVLRNERLDDLIPWYMKAKLAHLNNVKFIDDGNIDSTIGWINIRDKNYICVHGDFDSFSESGLSKLVMMLGFKPTAVLYGHLHHCSFDEIAGVKLIRSGCFSGTSDDFTVSKRISGKPSQMVCVIDDSGVKACYPVELE